MSKTFISATMEEGESIPEINEDEVFSVDVSGTVTEEIIPAYVSVGAIVKLGEKEHPCGLTLEVALGECAA